LIGAQRAGHRYWCFHDHRLRPFVDRRRDEVDLFFGDRCARVIDDAHWQADAQLRRLLHRHVEIYLEPYVRIDRRQLGRLRHAIAFTNRNVSDNSCGRRGHTVIAKIGARRADLFLHRSQLRFGCLERVGRTIGIHLARGARLQQLRRAIGFLPRVRDIDFALRAHRLEARDLSLRHARVDFHQQRARADSLARFRSDSRDESFDLWLNVGRSPRLDGSHKFGRLFDRFGLERDDINRHGGHPAPSSSPGAGRCAATATARRDGK
jgi:hypothetical protein